MLPATLPSRGPHSRPTRPDFGRSPIGPFYIPSSVLRGTDPEAAYVIGCDAAGSAGAADVIPDGSKVVASAAIEPEVGDLVIARGTNGRTFIRRLIARTDRGLSLECFADGTNEMVPFGKLAFCHPVIHVVPPADVEASQCAS